MIEALEPFLQRYSDVCSQLAHYGSYTIPAPVAAGLEQLHQNSGIPVDQLKFLLLAVGAYPVAFLYRLVPGTTLKHLFSIVLGIWMVNFLVSYQWLHTFICPLIAYFLLAISGPKYGRYVVWVFAMAYMSSLHIYRQWTDYLGWSFDVTTQMMIIVQKLTAIGFNYYDGSANQKPSESQKKFGIARLPGLLEYFGWIYMPSSVTMGPFIEYNDFIANIKEALPASPIVPAIWVFIQAVVFLGIHQVTAIYVPASRLKQQELLEHPGWYIYGYMLLCACSCHYKYYFGFKIAEGSAIMSGLGYNRDESTKDKILWDGAKGIDPWEFFFSQSYRTSSNSWNMQTNKWLRRYAYERMAPPANMYGTYAISAFWHGFYPGYYLFFLTVAPVSNLARWIRATIRPRFLKPDSLKMFYDVLSWLATTLTLNYFVMSFLLLDLESTWNLYHSMYYFVHIICFAAFVFSMTGILRAPKPAPGTEGGVKKGN